MTEEKKPNVIAGTAKVAGGIALAAAGVPMLVLPGPGMLIIAGGVALAGKGLSDIMGNEGPSKVADFTVELAKETAELTASIAVNTVAPTVKKAAGDASQVALSVGKTAAEGAAKFASAGIEALQKRLTK